MINHQRMLQTGAALYEQPSEIGLPQAYMSSVTIGANLKVRSRIEKKNQLIAECMNSGWGGSGLAHIRIWVFGHSSLRFNAIYKESGISNIYF